MRNGGSVSLNISSSCILPSKMWHLGLTTASKLNAAIIQMDAIYTSVHTILAKNNWNAFPLQHANKQSKFKLPYQKITAA